VIDAAIILGIIITSLAVPALIAYRNLNELHESKGRFDCVTPSFVVVSASVVFVSLMVYSAYAEFLYSIFFAPITFLTCLLLLVAAAVRKRRSQSLSMLLTLVAFLGVSWALVKNEGTIRPSIRWLLWSHRFKAEILAQPTPVDGELRHMEWEATGFAGVANNTVYLVFDPTDSLAMAAKSHSPGKFSGVPCEVPRVLRLESHWYYVPFYTDEEWGQRNRLNCE
jgi:hypothetical protein